MRNILEGTMPIIYNKLSTRVEVSLIAVPIATITFSKQLQLFYVNYKNISDVVASFPTKKECTADIEKKVLEWLREVMGKY